MREIKFRGRRVDNGEWVYGNIIRVDCSYVIAQDQFEWIDDSGLQGGDWWQVIPATVGQFIGLCDKNGREVYEGDIGSLGDLCWEVSWNKYTAGFVFKGYARISDLHMDLYTVIGNIHDNPDLLEAI